MEIKIRQITNGWLVTIAFTASANDPLGQRGGLAETFADTPEALCGLIAEQVLKLHDQRRT